MAGLEDRVARLERIVVSGRRSGQIGARWRVDARPWPTARDEECLIFQSWIGEDWKDVIIVKPDGTIQPP